MVQWLSLHAPNAGVMSLIPSWNPTCHTAQLKKMVHNVNRVGKLNIMVEQHELCCQTDLDLRPSFATHCDLEENQTSFFFSPL